MLAALVTHLRLTPAPQVARQRANRWHSIAWAFDFWIDGRGVSIAGHCGNLSRAVATAGGRALLAEPASQPQPVAALIRALATSDGIPIPDTRQTGWLARLLPIPDTKIK